MKNAFSLISSSLLLLFIIMVVHQYEEIPQENPNIILISLDSCRADRIYKHYKEEHRFPHIEKLMSDSVVFLNAFSHAASTGPSLSTLFTGNYPGKNLHRFSWGVGYRVTRNNVTLNLKKKGYHTISSTEGGFIQFDYNLTEGFDDYIVSDATSSMAFCKITQLINQLIDKKPFFAYIHTYETHHPYRREYYFGGQRPSGIANLDFNHIIYPKPITWTPSTEEKEYILDVYDGGIKQCDIYLELLVQALKRSGLYDDTIIILLADHGEEFWENVPIYSMAHAHCLYDYMLHVPLIIKLPKQKHSGKKIENQVGLIDIPLTILDFANVSDGESNYPMSGKSILPLIKGTSNHRDFHIAGWTQRGEWQYCIRTEKHKLIFFPESEKYELSLLSGYYLLNLKDLQNAVSGKV